MFGGVGFQLDGNMLVGVWKDSLIVCLGRGLHKCRIAGHASTMYMWRYVKPSDEQTESGLEHLF